MITFSYNALCKSFLCTTCNFYVKTTSTTLKTLCKSLVNHLKSLHDLAPDTISKQAREHFKRFVKRVTADTYLPGPITLTDAPYISIYRPEPLVKEGYICSEPNCMHLLSHHPSRIHKFSKHYKKKHPEVDRSDKFRVVLIQQLGSGTWSYLCPLGSTYDNQHIADLIPFSPEAEQSIILETQTEPPVMGQMEALADDFADECGGPYIRSWSSYVKQNITSPVNQQLFNFEEIKENVSVVVNSWFDQGKQYWLDNLQTDAVIVKRVMQYNPSVETNVFNPSSVCSKGIPALINLLCFCLNWLSLYLTNALPDCLTNLFNDEMISKLKLLNTLDMTPALLTQVLDLIFRVIKPLDQTDLFQNVLSTFLIASVWGLDDVAQIRVKLRGLSGMAMGLVAVLRFHTCICFKKTGDPSCFDRVTNQLSDPNSFSSMFFLHLVYTMSVPFSKQPSIKQYQLLGSGGDPMAVFKYGGVWSVDIHRKVVSLMLEECTRLIEEVSGGFDWENPLHGMFNEQRDIILQDNMFHDTPGYGLSISLDHMLSSLTEGDSCNFMLLRLYKKFRQCAMDANPVRKIISLITKTSTIINTLFFLSVPGGARCSQCVRLKLFNEREVSEGEVNMLRNMFIIDGKLMFIHYLCKHSSNKGLLFDYEKPKIFIPLPNVAVELLKFMCILLPLACELLRLEIETTVFSNDQHKEHALFVLNMRSMYPLIPLSYKPTFIPTSTNLRRSIILSRSQNIVTSNFFSNTNEFTENKGIKFSDYRPFIVETLEKLNNAYTNHFSNIEQNSVFSQTFDHTYKTSFHYAASQLNSVVIKISGTAMVAMNRRTVQSTITWANLVHLAFTNGMTVQGLPNPIFQTPMTALPPHSLVANPLREPTTVDIKKALALFGDNITLRPKQQQAVSRFWNHPSSDILCVLPCGFGKTMIVIVLGLLFQVICPNREVHFIVLCPFKSVIVEWLNKCKHLANKSFCKHLKSRDTIISGTDTKIVLVSCDSLDKDYVLAQVHQISEATVSIVIDEVHVVCEDAGTYRHNLGNSYAFGRFINRPYLLLSGTCPVTMAERIPVLFRASNLTVIRKSTAKQNVSIVVQDVSSLYQRLKHIESEIEKFINKGMSENRMMVFVYTKKDTEKWSRDLGEKLDVRTVFITGEHDGEELRKRLNDWKSGTFPVLFCTTCCAQAVDCATVTSVLITFAVKSVTLLQQMICRAGRDGKEATAMLFNDVRDLRVSDETHSVYRGRGCIRYRLQLLLDGEVLAESCLNDITRCSECKVLGKRRIEETFPDFTEDDYAEMDEIERLHQGSHVLGETNYSNESSPSNVVQVIPAIVFENTANIVRSYNNVLQLIVSCKNRCPIGLILNQPCVYCNERIARGQQFPWDRHQLPKAYHRCKRCASLEHKVFKCITRPAERKRLSSGVEPFQGNCCNACGLMYRSGYGDTIGTSLWAHDADGTQMLDQSWRSSNPRLKTCQCSSGFQDLFYPIMYLIYTKENNDSTNDGFFEFLCEMYIIDNNVVNYVRKIASLEDQVARLALQ